MGGLEPLFFRGAIESNGSLYITVTIRCDGSLRPLGTLLGSGSLCHTVTVTNYGSLIRIGTLARHGSLTRVVTFSTYGSLEPLVTVQVYGSLQRDGTLPNGGSLGSLGALRPGGSLLLFGTLSNFGSLTIYGVLAVDGSSRTSSLPISQPCSPSYSPKPTRFSFVRKSRWRKAQSLWKEHWICWRSWTQRVQYSKGGASARRGCGKARGRNHPSGSRPQEPQRGYWKGDSNAAPLLGLGEYHTTSFLGGCRASQRSKLARMSCSLKWVLLSACPAV